MKRKSKIKGEYILNLPSYSEETEDFTYDTAQVNVLHLVSG